MLQETNQDLETTSIGNGFMYNWIFHFNPFTEVWNAIPRDFYNEYWSDGENPRILRSRNISDLKDLLYKAHGDEDTIKEILNG
jgi:hypothetical protein